MTVGSRSTKMALGTCLPELVSEKKVLKLSSAWPMLASVGIMPSGWMPCSRQYSSQHALPIWAPAWPMWMEMHSLMVAAVQQLSSSGTQGVWRSDQDWTDPISATGAFIPHHHLLSPEGVEQVVAVSCHQEMCGGDTETGLIRALTLASARPRWEQIAAS